MIEKIYIEDFEIHCTKTDMNIINSYELNNISLMKKILNEALNKTTTYKTKRKINSLINEWIAHNVLYKYNLYREHTRDCNFESKQKINTKIIYFILSRISKIKYFINRRF